MTTTELVFFKFDGDITPLRYLTSVYGFALCSSRSWTPCPNWRDLRLKEDRDTNRVLVQSLNAIREKCTKRTSLTNYSQPMAIMKIYGSIPLPA